MWVAGSPDPPDNHSDPEVTNLVPALNGECPLPVPPVDLTSLRTTGLNNAFNAPPFFVLYIICFTNNAKDNWQNFSNHHLFQTVS